MTEDGGQRTDGGPSITEMVRQYAAANNLVRKKQIAKGLGLDAGLVANAVESLVKHGWLKRIGHGKYEFCNRDAHMRQAPMGERMWRAMQINPTFAASDVARQAGTTVNYVHKKFRGWRTEKLMELAGQRPSSGPGTWERLYRLTPKGKAIDKAPKLKPWKPDPIASKTAELNKLVITQAVYLRDDERQRAADLCRQIADALEKGDLQGT